jgi:DNA processing protein
LAVVDDLVRVSRDWEGVLRRLELAGVTLVTLEDADYPVRLRAIDLPPHVLFLEGDRRALSVQRAVAVVGTRRPSDAGRLVAGRIAAALAAAGASVISGLAVGIDGAAHAAVLAVQGITVGVLGGGHGRLFPAAHRRLAAAIVAAGGAVVSELPPDAAATRGTFPRRNRIVSGLSDATVVVEAGARSGALLTAQWTLEQGRECFVVPGSIDSRTSAGCLSLLREAPGAARIVAGIPELLEDLDLVRIAGSRSVGFAAGAELPPVPAQVADALVDGHATVDDLVATTQLPVASVLAALTMLESRGLVVDAYGRYRPAGVLATATGRSGA